MTGGGGIDYQGTKKEIFKVAEIFLRYCDSRHLNTFIG